MLYIYHAKQFSSCVESLNPLKTLHGELARSLLFIGEEHNNLWLFEFILKKKNALDEIVAGSTHGNCNAHVLQISNVQINYNSVNNRSCYSLIIVMLLYTICVKYCTQYYMWL